MIVQEPVQAAIWHCLNSYDYQDAVFLAERLDAEVGSSESIYLLASAYHRSGETAHANNLLRTHGPRTPNLRYLHAVTAHSLGRLQEAENILVEGLVSSGNTGAGGVSMQLATMPCNARLVTIMQETAMAGYGVLGSFVLRLLGDVFRQTQRPGKACAAYRAALAINPFLYTVYTHLMDNYTADKLDKSPGLNLSSSGGGGNSGNNNNNSSSTNNNNSQSSSGGSNNNNSGRCSPIDTNPDSVFTLDHVTDMSWCHGNTLCSVINNADCAAGTGVATQPPKPGSIIKGANTSLASSVSSGTNVGVTSSVLTQSGSRINTGHGMQQMTTPLTNMVLSCSQLCTPVGVAYNPLSNITPTPTLLPHHDHLRHSSPAIFQAPRKKRQVPVSSNSPSTATAISSMLSLAPPTFHLGGQNRLAMSPLTPSFGVLPLDLTAASITSPSALHTPFPDNGNNNNNTSLAFSTNQGVMNSTNNNSGSSTSSGGPAVPTIADTTTELMNCSFASSVDNSAGVAVLSPLVFSPLDTSSHNQAAPPPLPPKAFNLARRVLCRSSSNSNTSSAQSVLPVNSGGGGGTNAGGGSPGVSGGSSGGAGGGAVIVAGGAVVAGSNYHHSPSSTHTSVRRSSRLFGSASSVKENSKSRAFVAPKSPVRRSKPRALRPTSTSSGPAPTASTPASSTLSSSTPSSTTSTNTSLTELNNARNTNPAVLGGGPGGENIMPGDANILMPSSGDNNKGFSTSSSSAVHAPTDAKPAASTPLLPPPPPAANQPLIMLSQEDLSRQALSMQKHAAEGLMSLLRGMGSAYRLLSRFQCTGSVEAWQALPPHHSDTPFVLRCVAKAYFHCSDFQASARYFERVCSLAPQLVTDLEYYSTALWHQQKEVQLSALSQELLNVSRFRAAGWCAVGNCFSLQKEHETAIKFFSRAVQVEPECPYAYTLLGHEHIATEELERALGCYRTAIRISPRHYNAWYGIGLVLYKQEKYGHAEFNFRKALAIHPYSCVLLCHIAVVQHAVGKSNGALQTLSKALALEPNNAMCRYHRASVYLDLGQPTSAMLDLNILQPLVPKEANVYLLIGKAYQKLGDSLLAQMNFSWALDLDPKGAAGAGTGGGTGGGGDVLDDSLDGPDAEAAASDPQDSLVEHQLSLPDDQQQPQEDLLLVDPDLMQNDQHPDAL